jgi:hypothetical protein
MTTSSNDTLRLHSLTSNSSSTVLLKFLNSQFQFSNLLLATNRISLCSLGSNPTENTCHVSKCVALTTQKTFLPIPFLLLCARISGRCLELGLHVKIGNFTVLIKILFSWVFISMIIKSVNKIVKKLHDFKSENIHFHIVFPFMANYV